MCLVKSPGINSNEIWIKEAENSEAIVILTRESAI